MTRRGFIGEDSENGIPTFALPTRFCEFKQKYLLLLHPPSFLTSSPSLSWKTIPSLYLVFCELSVSGADNPKKKRTIILIILHFSKIPMANANKMLNIPMKEKTHNGCKKGSVEKALNSVGHDKHVTHIFPPNPDFGLSHTKCEVSYSTGPWTLVIVFT